MDATASFLRALAYQYPEYVSFTEKILQNRDAWGETAYRRGYDGEVRERRTLQNEPRR